MIRLLAIFIIIFINITAFAHTVMPASESSVITGYTRADAELTVTAETSGRLTDVTLGMGDVSGGGVFAVIDPVFTRYAIRSAEASLARMDAGIKKLESSIAYLKKEYDRVESLYLSEVETESRRDAAKQSYDQAELSLAELRQERAAAEVALAELNEKLKRQYIKVPAGWSITSKPLEKGTLVSAGQTIATAGDFRRVTVPLFVSDSQLRYLQSTKTFDITINGKPSKGRISRVNSAFDERTRKRQAEVVIDEAHMGGLMVEIPVVTDADGLMVHESTLNSRYANPRVTLANGREVRVNVLGRNGDMVIISPNQELKPGDELRSAE